MRNTVLVAFLLSVLLLHSCLDPAKLDNSRTATEKFYGYYNANQDDSMIAMLSKDFLENTDRNKCLSLFAENRRSRGKMCSLEYAGMSQVEKHANGKKETDITLTYKVTYELGDVLKEELIYVYNHDDPTGKINYLHREPWKD